MATPYTLYTTTAADPTWREWASEPPPQSGGGGDPGGGGGNPPPGGGSTVPIFGFGLDTEAEFTGLSGKVGQLLARRSYNTPSTGVPSSFSSCSAKNDRSLGATVSYLSIKPNIADTASGALDAKLTTFAKSCPAGTYVSWWPEGEAKRHANNPATFKTGLRRCYQVMKSANPAIYVGPCFMTYTLTSSAVAPYNNLANWISSPVDQSGDFVSWDTYNEGTGGSSWQSFVQLMSAAEAWTRNNSDLPVIIGEVGSNADPNNSARRGQWWTDAWAHAVAQQYPLMCGWQGDSFPGYTIYSPNDDAALAALSQINTAAKVGR